MKLGKIFICINILVLSLLMLTGYQEMLDGLRKIEPAWESVQKALKELNQQYPGANPLVADDRIFAVPGLFEYNYMDAFVIRKRKWFSRF